MRLYKIDVIQMWNCLPAIFHVLYFCCVENRKKIRRESIENKWYNHCKIDVKFLLWSKENKMSINILVVDDEKELADVIELYLTNDGYTVHKFYTGSEALDCIAHTDLDLAILDVMLPDADGFQICKKIREKSYYPIIMLTAKVADGDKIMGLTIGADDYITKPFNPLEVVARVKTQLRRYMQYNNLISKQEEPAHEYDIRGLIINKDNHKCFLFGKNCS